MNNTKAINSKLIAIFCIIGFLGFIYLSIKTNNDPAGIDKLKTAITLFIVVTHLFIAISYLYFLSADNDTDHAHTHRVGLTLLTILLTGILTYFVSLSWFSNFIPLNRNIDLTSSLPKAGDIYY
ncbi:hypothetical protein [Weissella minor]|uniref:hypothetical protein n=1 Tax=Weissella minor TaxID=1620 RepID=UPI003AF1F3BF